MAKQRINIHIDQEIYFYLKTQNTNISQLTNTLLQSYMSEEMPEKQELDEMKEQLDQINNERALLLTQMQKAKEQNKTDQKKRLENAKKAAQVLKQGGY